MNTITVLDRNANKYLYVFKGEPYKFVIGNTYYFDSYKCEVCKRYYFPYDHIYILEVNVLRKTLEDHMKLFLNKIFGGLKHDEVY